MKQFLCLGLLVVAGVALCAASPCGVSSLQSYIALGSSGCTIAGNTLFDFQVLGGSAGATEIASNSVSITPFGGALNPGLNAAINLTANGNILETMFTYRIQGPAYQSEVITLSKSSETSGGTVSDAQNYCAGGTFGPDGVTGCTGLAGTLATLDGFLNQDSAVLGGPSLVSITDDFTLDGTFGTATGGTITDQFTAVPEPSALLFTAFGLMLAARLEIRLRAHLKDGATGRKGAIR